MQETGYSGESNLDYKEIAKGLQEDLRKMIFRGDELEKQLNSRVDEIEERFTNKIDELENRLTKALLSKKSLEDRLTTLGEQNEELKRENELLDKENDEQSKNFVKVKKECDKLKQSLKEFGVLELDEIENDPAKETSFKNIIMKNMPKFTKFTDMSSLVPYLCMFQLVTPNDLMRINALSTGHEKAMEYYINILPMKGATAHIRFYKCLKEAVRDPHCNPGHRDLLRLFNQQDN